MPLAVLPVLAALGSATRTLPSPKATAEMSQPVDRREITKPLLVTSASGVPQAVSMVAGPLVEDARMACRCAAQKRYRLPPTTSDAGRPHVCGLKPPEIFRGPLVQPVGSVTFHWEAGLPTSNVVTLMD